MARSIVKEIVLEEKKPPWQVIMSNAETSMSSRRWLSYTAFCWKYKSG